MNLQLILSGVGGQGILFATRIFSELALEQGYNVIGSETHGMAQRGGSVISHLKIGDYSSPLVRQGTADILLSLDRDEAYRTLGFLKKGGLCFVNSPKEDFWDPGIKGYLEKNEIRAYSFPADKVALALGAPRSANLALIGYALSVPGVPFTYEDIKETIVRVSPPRFRNVNLQAFDTGYRGEKSIPPRACPEQGRRVGGD
ncbi:MAG: indolepyruvate oxidoreductase subunit beta [Anaerolineae bacterium]